VPGFAALAIITERELTASFRLIFRRSCTFGEGPLSVSVG
jgi:hypothetical protein